MSILVVDLEATCCNDGSIKRDEQETIEIGAVLADGSSWEPIDEFTEFIKPELHPTLTRFCRDLTSITQAEVDRAAGFVEVFDRFWKWCLLRRIDSFGSWGSFDKRQFRLDCSNHNVVYPFSGHLDLGKLFSKKTGRRRGNRRAMKILGLKPEGVHHRGIDDARNIVKMLPLLLPSGKVE